ncbi:MAG: DUF5666 domain-containing protein, partial [Pseudomonadota bacterium]|nr:DUF5666 domain-containing protein [Pseudomonadota bacterium]
LMDTNQQNFLLTALVSIALTACSGGDDNSVTSAIPASTLATTGVSTGTITGFGSVFVNGTRFDTDRAEIFHGDDQLNDVRELRKGMLVRVEGDIEHAVASRVHYEEDVKGPIDEDLADLSRPFSALGQRVVADSATVVDDNVVFPVAAGTILGISGHRQADGSLLALYIEQKDPADVEQYKVIGRVTNVDTTAMTFRIDQLLVNYGSAATDDLPGGVPAEGRLVEVEDANLAYAPASGLLNATEVEPAGKVEAEQARGREVELESVVTAIDKPGARFRISRFAVNLNASTQFRFGDAQDIGVGTLLQVQGRVNDADEIDASRVTFKRSGVRIAAHAESDADLDKAELNLLGVIVRVTDATEMRDGQSGFGLGDIRPGDYLEVSGFPCEENRLCAKRLGREQNENQTELRGVAANPDPVARRMRIQGVAVQADSNTRFRSHRERPLTANEFFAVITPGLTVLKATWGPAVKAGDVSVSAPQEIEIEDDFSSEKLDDDSGDDSPDSESR